MKSKQIKICVITHVRMCYRVRIPMHHIKKLYITTHHWKYYNNNSSSSNQYSNYLPTRQTRRSHM